MSEPSVDVKPKDLAQRLGVSVEKLMSGVVMGRFDQTGESDIIRDDEGNPAFRFPESRAYAIFGEDLDEVATRQPSTDEATRQPSTDEATRQPSTDDTRQSSTDEGEDRRGMVKPMPPVKSEEIPFVQAYPTIEKTPFHEEFFRNPPSTKAKLQNKLDELFEAYRRGQIGRCVCDSRAGFLVWEAKRLDVIGAETFVEMNNRIMDQTDLYHATTCPPILKGRRTVSKKHRGSK